MMAIWYTVLLDGQGPIQTTRALLFGNPLTYAALSGSIIAVAALINNGVSLNTQTTYERRTALMLAAEHLHIQVVAQLLDYVGPAFRDEAHESLREYDSLINVVGHNLHLQ